MKGETEGDWDEGGKGGGLGGRGKGRGIGMKGEMEGDWDEGGKGGGLGKRKKGGGLGGRGKGRGIGRKTKREENFRTCHDSGYKGMLSLAKIFQLVVVIHCVESAPGCIFCCSCYSFGQNFP